MIPVPFRRTTTGRDGRDRNRDARAPGRPGDADPAAERVFASAGLPRTKDAVFFGVLSREISIARRALVAAAAFAVAAPVLRAASITAGAMGDSYTEEWSLEDPEGSTKDIRSWVELLVRADLVDFGPLADFSSVSRDPRGRVGTGYSYTYNFAMSGATSESFLGSGAPDYLIFYAGSAGSYYSQVGSPTQPGTWGGFRAEGNAGHLDCGALIIGLNDVLIGSFNRDWTGPGTLAAEVADPVQHPGAYNLLQAVRTQVWEGLDVASGGPSNTTRMVVGNIPDLSTMPYMQHQFDPGWTFTPDERANVRANIQILNGWLAADASARGIPLLDLWSWWEEPRTNGLIVAGVVIDTAEAAPETTDLTRLDHFFLSDGIHPTPIAHGLLANRFLEILRDEYGESIEPLTEEQLVVLTGLVPLSIRTIVYDESSGYSELTWTLTPGLSPRIEWTDDILAPDPWDAVDGAAWDDLVDNGDGTWTWTDRGVDPDMGGVKPGDVPRGRSYRIILVE